MKLAIFLGSGANIFVSLILLATLTYSSSNGGHPRIEAQGISGGKIKKFDPSHFHRWMLWVDVFICYIIYTFIISVVELVVCYATSSWYFTRKKRSATIPTNWTMKTSLFFHIGTVCRLSIYKCFFKIFRNFAALLKKQLKKSKQHSNLIRFVMAACLPTLTWYEKVLKFISKDMLVMTCLWNDPYYEATRKSHFLVKVRHADKGFYIFPYINFIMFCLKNSLSLLVACLVYIYCISFDVSPFLYDISNIDTPMIPFFYTYLTSLFFVSVNCFLYRSG